MAQTDTGFIDVLCLAFLVPYFHADLWNLPAKPLADFAGNGSKVKQRGQVDMIRSHTLFLRSWSWKDVCIYDHNVQKGTVYRAQLEQLEPCQLT